MGSHALLSPSSAKQWLTCTPSVRLAANLPEVTSIYADEGTLAHSLGELIIKWRLRRITENEYKGLLLEYQSHDLYSPSMLDYCEDYAAFVIQRFNAIRKTHPGAMIFTETQVDMSPWVPEGFGTADVIIMADGWLEFIDLKYGQGVPVYAQENNQLMLYALGAYNLFDFFFKHEHTSLIIYQPRIDNISTYQTTYLELLKWAENVVVPKARQAFEGKGEFVPGDHCQFCKVKATCRANATYRLNMSGTFKLPELLTDEEIVEVLEKYKGLVNWAGAVQDYALQKAVNGKQWPGYKLVASRSNRAYADAVKVLAKLKKAGFTVEQIMDSKLKSVGALEKAIGKKDVAYHLTKHKLIIKPYGKPSLVPLTDGKPVYDRNQDAKEAFDFL